MTRMHAKRSPRSIGGFARTIAFALSVTLPVVAWASEIKFGAAPLATDDAGKLTSEARKQAVETLDNVPGEDAWKLYVWGNIDKGAEGPLYVEFYDHFQGQKNLTHRHEHADYQGEKFVSLEIELEGRVGFNKNHTYTVQLVQVNEKGKDVKLATGQLKLIKSGKQAPKQQDEQEDGESEGGDEQGDEPELTEQDKADKLDQSSAPPPVEPKKKGCNIGDPDGVAFALVMFAVFATRRTGCMRW